MSAVSESSARCSDADPSPRADRWPDPVVARLRALWTDGRSLSEIARVLTAEFGLAQTRSAIAGKVRRLELAPRGAPMMLRDRVSVRKYRADPGPAPSAGCEWIEGDDAVAAIRAGRDPHCRAPTLPGRPYCATHAKRAALKPSARRVNPYAGIYDAAPVTPHRLQKRMVAY